EPSGIVSAVILHPAVILAIHRRLERDVVTSGPGAEPARRQRQIDVDPFVVEILDALRGIMIAALRRLALALGAGESRHVAALVRLRRSSAELAQVAARALRIDRMALAARAIRRPRSELRFFAGGEVALEHIHVRPDV